MLCWLCSLQIMDLIQWQMTCVSLLSGAADHSPFPQKNMQGAEKQGEFYNIHCKVSKAHILLPNSLWRIQSLPLSCFLYHFVLIASSMSIVSTSLQPALPHLQLLHVPYSPSLIHDLLNNFYILPVHNQCFLYSWLIRYILTTTPLPSTPPPPFPLTSLSHRSTALPFPFRKVQASQGFQLNKAKQVTVRRSTSPHIKAGLDNPVGEKEYQEQARIRQSLSHC